MASFTLPADSSYSSTQWRFRIDALDNDHRLRLRRQLRVRRNSSLRNDATETPQLNVNSAGWDDLLPPRQGRVVPATDL